MPTSLRDLHTACRKWLGDHYDLEAIDAALSAAVVERYLVGDPVWLLIISGSGATKTETVVMLCDEYDDTVRDVSSISSDRRTDLGQRGQGSHRQRHRRHPQGTGAARPADPQGRDERLLRRCRLEGRDLVSSVLREVYDGFYTRDAGGGRRGEDPGGGAASRSSGR